MYDLRVDGTSILTSKSAIVGVDRSENGRYIVYAMQGTTSQPFMVAGGNAQLVTMNPNEWTVWLRDLHTGLVTPVGTGVHPLFVGNRFIVRTNALGVYRTDLAVARDSKLIGHAYIVQRVGASPLIAPDKRIYGVTDSSGNVITLYTLSDTGASRVVSVPVPSLVTAVALGNDGLYSLRLSAKGTEVWRQPIAEGSQGTMVTTLAPLLGITRLIIR